MKVQAGSYKARAVNGDFGTSKSKGTSYVRVGFQIVDGPFAGSTVTWDGWITDKTRQRVVDSLAYCGCTFPSDDFTDLTGLGDQEVEIVVEDNNYQKDDGTTVEASRVAWVNSLAGSVSVDQRMGDAERARLRASMKGEILRAKSRAPSPAPGPAPAPRPSPQ